MQYTGPSLAAIAAALMLAYVAPSGAQTAAKAATADAVPAANSSLQAACVDKVKVTLVGAERIRDIGISKGGVDDNINFNISANGGASRVVTCQVQKDGSLKLVPKVAAK